MSLFCERETCWMMNPPQLSEEWHRWKIGRLGSSHIGVVMNHLPHVTFDDDYIEESIIKTKTKIFSAVEQERMAYGTLQEKEIQERYAKHIGKELANVSLAIWKNDARMAGSLDFEFADNPKAGGEIKAPGKAPVRFVEYFNAQKNKYISPHRRCRYEKQMHHIYRNHYDQMIYNGIITNKNTMHYVIEDRATKSLYYDSFPVDEQYFWSQLYPAAQDALLEIDELLKLRGQTRLSLIDYLSEL